MARSPRRLHPRRRHLRHSVRLHQNGRRHRRDTKRGCQGRPGRFHARGSRQRRRGRHPLRRLLPRRQGETPAGDPLDGRAEKPPHRPHQRLHRYRGTRSLGAVHFDPHGPPDRAGPAAPRSPGRHPRTGRRPGREGRAGYLRRPAGLPPERRAAPGYQACQHPVLRRRGFLSGRLRHLQGHRPAGQHDVVWHAGICPAGGHDRAVRPPRRSVFAGARALRAGQPLAGAVSARVPCAHHAG